MARQFGIPAVVGVTDPYFIELLSWVDRYRRLGVWANADYARDAEACASEYT